MERQGAEVDQGISVATSRRQMADVIEREETRWAMGLRLPTTSCLLVLTLDV
jgi:hypothetical protein